jgi:chromosome segregation ATPase
MIEWSTIISILWPALIVGVFGYVMARTNREQSIEIGTLREKLSAVEHLELTFENEIRSKALDISEKDTSLQEQQLNLLEKKETIRSYRAIINRHEGRITVYENNEFELKDELTKLRNRVLTEEAKQRFLEKENNELRAELFMLRHGANGTTPSEPPQV